MSPLHFFEKKGINIQHMIITSIALLAIVLFFLLTWFVSFGNASTFIVSVVATYIAYQNYMSNEKIRKSQVFQYYVENYEKVSEALALIIQEAKCNNKAMELLWTARDQARLFLPEDIANYTELLRKKATALDCKNSALKQENNPSKKNEISKEISELIKFFSEESGSCYKRYRKHIEKLYH